MVFGVFISPAAFIGGCIMVILAMVIPFFIIEAVLSPLPEPLRTVGVIGLSYVGMPVLLCYLHYKKLLGTGFGSGFFILYTWFYLVFGIIMIVGTYYAEGGPNYGGMGPGAVMATIGACMIWWRRKVSVRFNAAVEDGTVLQAEMEREEAIQVHAEAILRAEQMRNPDSR
jgi:hypothetical protein